MRSVKTEYYTVIEVIGGLDVYSDDLLVCCIHGKSLNDFTYDQNVDTDKLETAIDNEMELLDLIEDL